MVASCPGKIKIDNPRRFKSWLEGAVSGLTLPPHPGVSHFFGCITQVLANESFRLAPQVIVQPVTLTFSLIPPFPERLYMKITTGCSGSSIKELSHELSPAELQALYDEFVTQRRSEKARREFARRIVGARDRDQEAGTYEDQ